MFIFSFLYEYMKPKKRIYSKCIFILIVVTLALLFSMREFIFEDFGTDYYSYKEWYSNVTSETIVKDSLKNLGYNILNYVVKCIFNNYYIFLFICGIIINYCILKFIEKNCNTFSLPLLVYISLFYTNTFNITRQWIACAIFLYGFSYIKEKKFLKYFIVCVISFLFHSSAIFLILLYPILRNNQKLIKKELIILGIGIITVINSSTLLQLILSSKYVVLDQYSKYINYANGVSNYVYPAICTTVLLLLNYIMAKKNVIEDEAEKIVYLCIALVFSILSMKSIVFYRFCIYLLPALILTIPIVLESFKKKDRAIVLEFICLILCYIFI